MHTTNAIYYLGAKFSFVIKHSVLEKACFKLQSIMLIIRTIAEVFPNSSSSESPILSTQFTLFNRYCRAQRGLVDQIGESSV